MKLSALLGGAAIALGALLPVGSVTAQEVLRVAHAYKPGTSVAIYWDELAKRVNERAANKVKLQVFHSGQLGGDEQVFRGMKLGTIHFGSGAAANEGVVTDAYFWLDLPYVLKSRESAVRVFADKEVDGYLRNKLRQDAGTVLLGHIEVGGFRMLINNKRPLRTPDDVKGLKFRALSNPIDIALLKSWNFTPTPLPWSDTYTSLEQGMIDGLNLQAAAVDAFGFQELVKYATETRTLMTFHVAQVSAKTFDSLDAATQKVIMDASVEALKIANQADREDEKTVLDRISKRVTVYRPTEAEMKRWEAPARALWPQFTEKLDKKLLDRIVGLQQ
jgi:TRAP-type C4-dicarboxylate transport system substrate-binding protein